MLSTALAAACCRFLARVATRAPLLPLVSIGRLAASSRASAAISGEAAAAPSSAAPAGSVDCAACRSARGARGRCCRRVSFDVVSSAGGSPAVGSGAFPASVRADVAVAPFAACCRCARRWIRASRRLEESCSGDVSAAGPAIAPTELGFVPAGSSALSSLCSGEVLISLLSFL